MTLLSEAYSELTQTSKMELFGKIVVLNVGCLYLQEFLGLKLLSQLFDKLTKHREVKIHSYILIIF